MKKIFLLNLMLAFIYSIFGETTTINKTYSIDVKNSSIEWTGTKKIGTKHNGTIKVLNGSIVQKGDLFTGTVSIDMNSITDLDLKDKEDNTHLVEHLKSADFFNVEKFKTAQLDLISAKLGAQRNEYLITANFTIVGKKQKIEFPAKIIFAKDSFSVEGTLEIDRTKFGLKYGSGNIFKELVADKIISDMFTLKFKIKSSN